MMDGMKRTTISLDEPTLRDLHRVAEERRTSVAAIVREAVEAKLAGERPRPRSIGAGESGHSDTSRRAGDERPATRQWR